jgi:protein involved in polysaccharide export with SLBB domain
VGRRSYSAGPLLTLGRLAIGVGALALWAASNLSSQAVAEDREARRLSATRTELVALQERLAASPKPDTVVAAVLQRRLSDGDFHPGDGIALTVEGEQVFTDTFVVNTTHDIELPMVGTVPLRGVLYREIEPYLRQQLSRVLRDPVVHARGFVRLAVTGAVPRPGYYLVPGDGPLSETFRVAGGLNSNAKLNDARALRGGQEVMDKSAVRSALASGQTLEQLSLSSGDELSVPGSNGASAFELIKTISILLTIPLTIYALTQIGGK